jgi:hypothetical protein
LFQRIKNLLCSFRHLMSSKVVIPNWSRLEYMSTVYAVVPAANGKFTVNVHLFLDEPIKDPTEENAQDNIVMIVPMNIVQDSAEKVIANLYLLGPIFHRTSYKALEMDETGKVIKVWSIIPPEHAPTVFREEKGIRPTHVGSDSIN